MKNRSLKVTHLSKPAGVQERRIYELFMLEAVGAAGLKGGKGKKGGRRRYCARMLRKKVNGGRGL